MPEEDFGVNEPCANLPPSHTLHSLVLQPQDGHRPPPGNPTSHAEPVGILGSIATHLPAGYSHKGCTDDSSYTQAVLQFSQTIDDVRGVNNLPEDLGAFPRKDVSSHAWRAAINSQLG